MLVPRSVRSRVLAVGVVVMICGASAPANAQSTTPLASILPELIGNTITLVPSDLPDQPNHIAHFRPGSEQLLVPSQVNQTLLTMLSTYPLGSPSGGFTYTIDPALGTLTRSSDSFGPSFAERALTTGRGKVSLGFEYQHAMYDTLEGLNLRNGEIKFYIPHSDCCSRGAARAQEPDGSRLTPPFEGDLIEATLKLKLVSDTSVVFATYGVSDRLDIGVAVPFVHVSVDASVLAKIERLSTVLEPEVHQFEGTNPDEHTFTAAGAASGIGDIVLRAKYAFNPAAEVSLGGAVESRLPTGNEADLLGTGAVQTKLFGIASMNHSRFAPHLNVGYTFSSKGALPKVSLPDEVNVTVGFDTVVSPAMTMSFDVLSRTLRGAGQLSLSDKVFEYAPAGAGSGGTGGGGGGGGGGTGGGGGGTPAPAQTQRITKQELKLQSGNLNLYLGAAGVRFSPWRTLLVSANLLFPLTDAGLRDRVTPTIGIDYVF